MADPFDGGMPPSDNDDSIFDQSATVDTDGQQEARMSFWDTIDTDPYDDEEEEERTLYELLDSFDEYADSLDERTDDEVRQFLTAILGDQRRECLLRALRGEELDYLTRVVDFLCHEKVIHALFFLGFLRTDVSIDQTTCSAVTEIFTVTPEEEEEEEILKKLFSFLIPPVPFPGEPLEDRFLHPLLYGYKNSKDNHITLNWLKVVNHLLDNKFCHVVGYLTSVQSPSALTDFFGKLLRVYDFSKIILKCLDLTVMETPGGFQTSPQSLGGNMFGGSLGGGGSGGFNANPLHSPTSQVRELIHVEMDGRDGIPVAVNSTNIHQWAVDVALVPFLLSQLEAHPHDETIVHNVFSTCREITKQLFGRRHNDLYMSVCSVDSMTRILSLILSLKRSLVFDEGLRFLIDIITKFGEDRQARRSRERDETSLSYEGPMPVYLNAILNLNDISFFSELISCLDLDLSSTSSSFGVGIGVSIGDVVGKKKLLILEFVLSMIRIGHNAITAVIYSPQTQFLQRCIRLFWQFENNSILHNFILSIIERTLALRSTHPDIVQQLLSSEVGLVQGLVNLDPGALNVPHCVKIASRMVACRVVVNDRRFIEWVQAFVLPRSDLYSIVLGGQKSYKDQLLAKRRQRGEVVEEVVEEQVVVEVSGGDGEEEVEEVEVEKEEVVDEGEGGEEGGEDDC